MATPNFYFSRRHALTMLGVGALAAGVGSKAWAQTAGPPTLLVDGHVHVTNRVYWEKADLWQPRDAGWDYARARASGVNCIIDNLGTYGAWNYNYTPKQALRLIETAHRYAQQHADKMAIVTSVADARRVIASGLACAPSSSRARAASMPLPIRRPPCFRVARSPTITMASTIAAERSSPR
jgi:hypothetical protein